MLNKLGPGTKCPCCEHNILKLQNKKLSYEFKGRITFIEREVLICNTCNEIFLQPKDEKEVEEILTNMRGKI